LDGDLARVEQMLPSPKISARKSAQASSCCDEGKRATSSTDSGRHEEVEVKLTSWMEQDDEILFRRAIHNAKQQFEDPEKRHEPGQLLFRLARQAHELRHAVSMCSSLLEASGLKSVDVRDRRSRQTPLFYACSSGAQQFVQFLLERRANPNFLDQNMQTPLFYAVKHGHLAVTETLLEGGAVTQQRDINEQTPLFYAVGHGEDACAKLLVQQADEASAAVGITDKHNRTPLFYADSVGTVELLLQHRCDMEQCDLLGRTALFAAMYTRRKAVAQLMLEKKAGVDIVDVTGVSLLAFARLHGFPITATSSPDGATTCGRKRKAD